MDTVRQALASVTAVEKVISGVLAEVGALLGTRVASAEDLAEAVRALLQRIPAESRRRPPRPPDGRRRSIRRTSSRTPTTGGPSRKIPWRIRPARGRQLPAERRPDRTARFSGASRLQHPFPGTGQRSAGHGGAERGSGGVAERRGQPGDRAGGRRILARAARELLPRTGTRQPELTARLGEAARQLGGGPGQVGTAVRRSAEATIAVLSAANDLARGQAQDLAELAGIAEDLLPYTGGQQDSLTRDLNDALVRADRSAMGQPPEATLAAVAAAVRESTSSADLRCRRSEVITRATAGLAERVGAAPALAAGLRRRCCRRQAGARPHSMTTSQRPSRRCATSRARDGQSGPQPPSRAPCPCSPDGSSRTRGTLSCTPSPARSGPPARGTANPGEPDAGRRASAASGDRSGSGGQERAHRGHYRAGAAVVARGRRQGACRRSLGAAAQRRTAAGRIDRTHGRGHRAAV